MFRLSRIAKQISPDWFLPNTKIVHGVTDEWLFRNVTGSSKDNDIRRHFNTRTGDTIFPFGGMLHIYI